MTFNRLIRSSLFAFVAAVFLSSSPELLAQLAGNVLTAPTVQSGVSGGLEEILRWTFLFLKFLAIIAVAYGSYLMWDGKISSGVWAYAAAISLFMAPALVDLAQRIGQSTQ